MTRWSTDAIHTHVHNGKESFDSMPQGHSFNSLSLPYLGLEGSHRGGESSGLRHDEGWLRIAKKLEGL